MPSNIYQPRPSTIALKADTGDRGMDQAVYVNTNESLQIKVLTSIGSNVPAGTSYVPVTVSVDMRLLTVKGVLQYLTFTFNPQGTHDVETFTTKLPEGFLLNLSAYTAGAEVFQTSTGMPVFDLPGETWCQAMIVAPVQPNVYTATFLAQGYITDEERITFPARQGTGGTRQGFPFMRFGSVISGIGLAYTCPPNSVDEITGVNFVYSTTGGGIAREVYLAFQSSMGTPATIRNIYVPFEGSQSPGTTQNYQAWMLAPAFTNPLGSFQTLPMRQIMLPGQYLIPGAANGDPADAISQLTVWGNEWLVP